MRSGRDLAGDDHARHPRPQRRRRRTCGAIAGWIVENLGRGDALARQPLLPRRTRCWTPRPRPSRRSGGRPRSAGTRASPTSTSATRQSSARGHPVRRLRWRRSSSAHGYIVRNRLTPDGTCPECGKPLAGLAGSAAGPRRRCRARWRRDAEDRCRQYLGRTGRQGDACGRATARRRRAPSTRMSPHVPPHTIVTRLLAEAARRSALSPRCSASRSGSWCRTRVLSYFGRRWRRRGGESCARASAPSRRRS